MSNSKEMLNHHSHDNCSHNHNKPEKINNQCCGKNHKNESENTSTNHSPSSKKLTCDGKTTILYSNNENISEKNNPCCSSESKDNSQSLNAFENVAAAAQAALIDNSKSSPNQTIKYNFNNNSNQNNILKKYNLELLQKLERHEDKVWQLSWHPVEDLFASCGSDKNICIWGAAEGDKYALKAILEDSHSRTIRSVAWDHSGTYLATASFDSWINIWKKSGLNFECVATLEGHENEVKSVSWSVSGNYLATCSRDKTIWIWDFENENDFSCNTVLQGHSQDVKMVKWSPIEDILFSCSYDNTIKVWKNDLNEEDWVCVNTLNEHSSTIWSIDITKDGFHLISVGDDRSIILWKIEDKSYEKITKLQKLNSLHERSVYSCAINFAQNLIATGSSDNGIKILELNLNAKDNADTKDNSDKYMTEVGKNEKAHDDDVNCVIWHPKKNLLASCSDDNLIKLWTIKEIEN